MYIHVEYKMTHNMTQYEYNMNFKYVEYIHIIFVIYLLLHDLTLRYTLTIM